MSETQNPTTLTITHRIDGADHTETHTESYLNGGAITDLDMAKSDFEQIAAETSPQFDHLDWTAVYRDAEGGETSLTLTEEGFAHIDQ